MDPYVWIETQIQPEKSRPWSIDSFIGGLTDVMRKAPKEKKGKEPHGICSKQSEKRVKSE